VPAFRVMVDFLHVRGAQGVELLVVTVYINGQRAGHPFLVDPGLPFTTIHRRLVSQYGLTNGPQTLEQLDVYPTPYHVFHGRQANVDVRVGEWGRAQLGVDGVLGMNWFQRYAQLCLNLTSQDDGPYIELTPH